MSDAHKSHAGDEFNKSQTGVGLDPQRYVSADKIDQQERWETARRQGAEAIEEAFRAEWMAPVGALMSEREYKTKLGETTADLLLAQEKIAALLREIDGVAVAESKRDNLLKRGAARIAEWIGVTASVTPMDADVAQFREANRRIEDAEYTCAVAKQLLPDAERDATIKQLQLDHLRGLELGYLTVHLRKLAAPLRNEYQKHIDALRPLAIKLMALEEWRGQNPQTITLPNFDFYTAAEGLAVVVSGSEQPPPIRPFTIAPDRGAVKHWESEAAKWRKS